MGNVLFSIAPYITIVQYFLLMRVIPFFSFFTYCNWSRDQQRFRKQKLAPPPPSRNVCSYP